VSHAEGLLEELQQAAIRFCSAAHGFTSSGGGPTLRKLVKASAARVIQPCIGLVKAMEHEHRGDVKQQVPGNGLLGQWGKGNVIQGITT